MGKIDAILKKHLVISLEDATKILGNDKAVYRLCEKGKLAKVEPKGLGFFSLVGLEEGTAHFAIVSKYYSNCVISGKTALSLYDLSLDYISKIDVDIPNVTNLSNDLLNVHRVVESKISHVVKGKFEDKGIPFNIKIYSVERTLFEAHKYYRGSDSYFYALKQYSKLFLDKKNPGKQFNIILEINKKIGQEMIDLLNMGASN